MHVITPYDLKQDAIERYSEMLLKPQFEGQEKFLKNEIKRLQNERLFNTLFDNRGNSSDSNDCGYNLIK